MRRGRPVSHGGMTRQERAIMDRWDAGESSGVISQTTGVEKYRVERIISTYHDSGEERGAAIATARGSAALLAALQAAR